MPVAVFFVCTRQHGLSVHEDWPVVGSPLQPGRPLFPWGHLMWERLSFQPLCLLVLGRIRETFFFEGPVLSIKKAFYVFGLVFS